MKKKIFPILIAIVLVVVCGLGYSIGQKPNAVEPTSPPVNSIIPSQTPSTSAEPAPQKVIESDTHQEQIKKDPVDGAQTTESQQTESFKPVNETVYATKAINIRDKADQDGKKIGVLENGKSITRIGIGQGEFEGWSKVKLSDGTIGYIRSEYLTAVKPGNTVEKPVDKPIVNQPETGKQNQDKQEPEKEPGIKVDNDPPKDNTQQGNSGLGLEDIEIGPNDTAENMENGEHSVGPGTGQGIIWK